MNITSTTTKEEIYAEINAWMSGTFSSWNKYATGSQGATPEAHILALGMCALEDLMHTLVLSSMLQAAPTEKEQWG